MQLLAAQPRRYVIEVKQFVEERNGARDDRHVEAEQEPAQRRHQADADHVPQASLRFHGVIHCYG